MLEILIIKIKPKLRLGPEMSLMARRNKHLKCKKKEESKQSCRKFKYRRSNGN
jgi:hypothetical protein